MTRTDWQALCEECAREEEALTFSRFTRDDAFQLGSLFYEACKKRKIAVAIEITVAGLTVFRYFPEGSTAANGGWLARKHNMVMAREMSSRHAQCVREAAGKTMEDWLMDPKDFAPCGGGFPIRVKDVGVIGSVCVSGLPSEEDHRLLVETLHAFLERS